MKHTPTPWRTGKFHMASGNSADHIYSDQSKEPNEGIARCYGWVGQQEAQANADFIVRACNAHDELVAALGKAVQRLKPGGNTYFYGNPEFAWYDYYVDALAKAEGK